MEKEENVIMDLVQHTVKENEKRRKYFGRCLGCEPYIGDLEMYSTLHGRMLNYKEIDKAVKVLVLRGFLEVVEIKGKRRLSSGGGRVSAIDDSVLRSIAEHYAAGDFMRKGLFIEKAKIHLDSESRFLKPGEVKDSIKRLFEANRVCIGKACGEMTLKPMSQLTDEEL